MSVRAGISLSLAFHHPPLKSDSVTTESGFFLFYSYGKAWFYWPVWLSSILFLAESLLSLAFHHPPPKPDSVTLESGFFLLLLYGKDYIVVPVLGDWAKYWSAVKGSVC